MIQLSPSAQSAPTDGLALLPGAAEDSAVAPGFDLLLAAQAPASVGQTALDAVTLPQGQVSAKNTDTSTKQPQDGAPLPASAATEPNGTAPSLPCAVPVLTPQILPLSLAQAVLTADGAALPEPGKNLPPRQELAASASDQPITPQKESAGLPDSERSLPSATAQVLAAVLDGLARRAAASAPQNPEALFADTAEADNNARSAAESSLPAEVPLAAASLFVAQPVSFAPLPTVVLPTPEAVSPAPAPVATGTMTATALPVEPHGQAPVAAPQVAQNGASLPAPATQPGDAVAASIPAAPTPAIQPSAAPRFAAAALAELSRSELPADPAARIEAQHIAPLRLDPTRSEAEPSAGYRIEAARIAPVRQETGGVEAARIEPVRIEPTRRTIEQAMADAPAPMVKGAEASESPVAATLPAPVTGTATPLTPVAATTPANRAEALPALDLAQIVENIARAREEARPGQLPAQVEVSVRHAEFGPVSVRFEQVRGDLTVALSSADPEFARAVASVATPERGAAERLMAQTDTTGARQDASLRQSNADAGGQAAGQPRNGPNSQGNGSGSGSERRGHEPATRAEQARNSGAASASTGTGRHGGIFA